MSLRINSNGKNTEKEAQKNYIYQKHGISEALFDSSMVWYTRESKELMAIYENLDAILAVDGLDSLFIGAADLGRSIKGRNDGTDLQVVYNDICKRVRAKDRFLGVAIGPTAEEAKRVKDLGAQWVVFGMDVKALALGLKSNLDAVAEY